MMLTALLMCLMIPAAQADTVVNVGVGKGILGEPGTPFERVVAAGYQFVLSPDVFVRPEVGWFGDFSGQGRSSFWAAPLLGVRALSSVGPEFHAALGPGYLDSPDQVLGGHFQFSLEAGMGLTAGHTHLGLVWKHLSSGGINMPNHGRDFLMLQWRMLGL